MLKTFILSLDSDNNADDNNDDDDYEDADKDETPEKGKYLFNYFSVYQKIKGVALRNGDVDGRRSLI